MGYVGFALKASEALLPRLGSAAKNISPQVTKHLKAGNDFLNGDSTSIKDLAKEHRDSLQHYTAGLKDKADSLSGGAKMVSEKAERASERIKTWGSSSPEESSALSNFGKKYAPDLYKGSEKIRRGSAMLSSHAGKASYILQLAMAKLQAHS